MSLLTGDGWGCCLKNWLPKWFPQWSWPLHTRIVLQVCFWSAGINLFSWSFGSVAYRQTDAHIRMHTGGQSKFLLFPPPPPQPLPSQKGEITEVCGGALKPILRGEGSRCFGKQVLLPCYRAITLLVTGCFAHQYAQFRRMRDGRLAHIPDTHDYWEQHSQLEDLPEAYHTGFCAHHTL